VWVAEAALAAAAGVNLRLDHDGTAQLASDPSGVLGIFGDLAARDGHAVPLQ